MPNHEHKQICHRCVPDTHLAQEVWSIGQLSQCSYCYESRNCVTMGTLADRIHDVISAYFMLTPNHPSDIEDFITIALGEDWERRGCTPQEIVHKVAGLNENIADEVVRLLSAFHAYPNVKYGSEDPYGYEARYEEVGPDAGPFWSMWNTVPESIRHQARFFNADAENALNGLFMDLSI